MNDFKKRLSINLGIALFLIFALLGGILFFRGNIKDYLSRITQARRVLADQTAKVYDEAMLEAQYNSKAKNYMNVLESAIPSYDELINLNKSLQTLANQYGLTYAFSFADEMKATGDSLGSIGFSLALGGDDVKTSLSFLKAMETFKYLNTISNVSWKSDGNKFTTTLKGRVYYR